MSDESKAAIAVSLWCIAFNGGILLAAEHKAVGFMIAVSATLIFLVYLAGGHQVGSREETAKALPAGLRPPRTGGTQMAGVIAVALAALFGVLTTLIVISAAMDDTDERGEGDESGTFH